MHPSGDGESWVDRRFERFSIALEGATGVLQI